MVGQKNVCEKTIGRRLQLSDGNLLLCTAWIQSLDCCKMIGMLLVVGGLIMKFGGQFWRKGSNLNLGLNLRSFSKLSWEKNLVYAMTYPRLCSPVEKCFQWFRNKFSKTRDFIPFCRVPVRQYIIYIIADRFYCLRHKSRHIKVQPHVLSRSSNAHFCPCFYARVS